MKYAALFTMLPLALVHSPAYAYLGPGLGFGVSTLILVILFSLVVALGFILVNLLRTLKKAVKKNYGAPKAERNKIGRSS